jgi:hypothetical protein
MIVVGQQMMDFFGVGFQRVQEVAELELQEDGLGRMLDVIPLI